MSTIEWEDGASSLEGLPEGQNVATPLNVKHFNFGYYDKWKTDFSLLFYFFLNYKVEHVLRLLANCVANCLLVLNPHSESIKHFLLIC